jgi:hypothetical protein
MVSESTHLLHNALDLGEALAHIAGQEQEWAQAGSDAAVVGEAAVVAKQEHVVVCGVTEADLEVADAHPGVIRPSWQR